MLAWDEITEIECIGEDDIYDLEVPETNTYIAQGFVNHNSGKDFLISNLLTYIVYYLLKQPDPSEFLGLKSREPIDIVNVSFDETQAKTVFFERFKNRIKNCINPITKKNFFEEQGMDLSRDIQKNSIIFPKNITAYSLNSVKFKAEGKNVVFAVFDEIAQFRFDKAEAIRRHIKTTAKATCPKFFKLFYISFLTNGSDYMAHLLEKAEKGEIPKCLYMRESTWSVRSQRGCPKELKPYIVNRSTFQDEFDEDQENAMLMFECKIPKTRGSSFIKRPEKILQSVGYILDQNGEKIFREDPRVNQENIIVYDDELKDLEFESWFKPYYTWEIWQLEKQYEIQPSESLERQMIQLKERQQTAEYYIHIDLSRGVVDSAGIGLAHRYYIMDRVKIYIDLLLAIRARKGQEIDMSKILDFILLRLHKGKVSLGGLGFHIHKITSDGWNSSLFLNLCERENIDSQLISLERTTAPYNTFKDFIYKQDINYYPYAPLLREVEELIITDKGKINHPRTSRRRMKEEGLSRGSKDTCFTGDTKILLVDGRELSIKELVEEQKNGKQNYIYSIDNKKEKIMAKKIDCVFQSGIENKFIEIKLDNNEIVKCTLNHPFMIRDGGYKRADNLKVGDSLMPLYRKINNSYLKGYREIYNPFENKWHYEHREFSKAINNQKFVVHHKDYNKLNNNPNNLQIMSLSAHAKLHGLLATKEKLDKMHKAAHLFNISVEGRRKHSEALKKTCRLIKEGKIKHTSWNQRDDFKGYKDQRMKKFIMAGANARRGASNWCKGLKVETNLSLQKLMLHSSITKLGFDITKYREYIINKYLNENVSPRQIGAILGCSGDTIRKRIKKWGVFNKEQSNKIHRLNIIKAKKFKNHKIKEIRIIDTEKQPIYDMIIEDTHNFAISAGVFVHNSDCCAGLCDSMTQDSEEGDMAWSSDNEEKE